MRQSENPLFAMVGVLARPACYDPPVMAITGTVPVMRAAS
jgi:hypothetical protein